MVRVGVLGATGYAGAELVRLLSGHPNVEITTITSRQYAGKPFSDVYPSMKGIFDTHCEEYVLKRFIDNVDVAFMALPHKLPMAFAPELIENHVKVIDLSADFRFRDVALYEKHYQPHAAAGLSEKAVYGLSEVNTKMIQCSSLIGNPGCYPTTLLLPLLPLIENKLIIANSVIADAKSGVSGAGRSISLGTHFCEVNENFKAYKIANHRHTPEMEENLSIAAGQPVQITFVPHLVPMIRGMLTTIYAEVAQGINEIKIRECLEDYYNKKYFVRICSEGIFPEISNVKTTNFCDIGLKMDIRKNRIILVSAIDNLVKGAAGQAVQNMNLMLGIDEKAGLDASPLPV